MSTHKLKTRDIATKVVSKCGTLRFAVASTRSIADATLRTHRLVPRTYGNVPFLQLACGNITFAAMLASLLQSEERVESRLVTPAATAVAESSALGECRSYVSNSMPEVLPNTLRVQRILYEQSKPVVSATTAVWEGDLSESVDPLQTLTPQQIDCLMTSDMTMHAMNFWRKSEGAQAAVLAKCKVRVNEEDETYSDWAVQESCGVLAQSIVDGGANDAALAALQLGLLHASTTRDGSRSSTSSSSLPDEALWTSVMQRNQHDTIVQDLLSLASGDFEGSFAVATKLRQVTEEVSKVRDAIQPLRLAMKLPERPLCELDVQTADRTPLDVFCRCSKADFLAALKAVPEATRQQATAEPVVCTYCRKSFVITLDDLKTLV